MLAKQKEQKKKEGRLRKESLEVLQVLGSGSGLILSALAVKVNREMGNLFRSVRLLEEKGLVSRATVHGLNVISLTKAGEEVLKFTGSKKK